LKNLYYIKRILQQEKHTIIGFVSLLIIWILLSYSGLINETLLAKPVEVWQVVVQSFSSEATKSQQLHVHFISTVWLSFKGWALSITFGVIIGIIIGQSQKILSLLEPTIELVRAIPPILAFPLFLVAHNFGMQAYVWTIVFGCMPIVIIPVAQGVRSINKAPFEILDMSLVKKWVKQLLYFVQILPSIILSARLSFSFSLIIAIVCEMVFTPRSGWALGALARDSELNFDTPLFYGCALTIGIYGYIINRFLSDLEKRIQ
jgi:ABC-type nitrate/sulfonate/bicarbonate transport system permease component